MLRRLRQDLLVQIQRNHDRATALEHTVQNGVSVEPRQGSLQGVSASAPVQAIESLLRHTLIPALDGQARVEHRQRSIGIIEQEVGQPQEVGCLAVGGRGHPHAFEMTQGQTGIFPVEERAPRRLDGLLMRLRVARIGRRGQTESPA